MIQDHLAIELFIAEEPGGEQVDLAAEAEVGLAAGDLGGEGLPGTGGSGSSGARRAA